MKKLFLYFKKKPSRLLYAGILLGVIAVSLKSFMFLVFQAELFAKLVADPDHHMQHGDKLFSGLNSDNIRSQHEASQISDADFNIIFLGDSFIYGFVMGSKLSPPAQLENILRDKYHRNDINVINFGWTSSSPILSYRLLQDIGSKYKPDLVLMSVDMTDYRDEWFYKSLLQEHGYYQYIKQYPRTAYYLKRIMELLDPISDTHTKVWGYPSTGDYFVAQQPMETSLNLFDNVYATLLEMNDYSAKTLHVPFIVFVPPRHWQYTNKESPDSWENGTFDVMGPYALENFRYFDSKKSSAPFPIITMLEDFQNTDRFPLNFQGDSHWNQHGANFFAGKVAEKIAGQIEKNSSFEKN